MKRLAAGILLGFVFVWLTGCTSSLTGGSVPTGIIDGTVNADTRGTEPARVSLTRVPVVLRDGAGQVLQTTISNAKGEFAFNNVAPGMVEVISTQDSRRGEVRFTMREGAHARVTLLIAKVNPSVVKLNIHSLKPASPDGSIELDEDEDDVFTVNGEDENGQAILNLPVSWVVIGGIGDITPDGNFNAQRVGQGELIVQHDGVQQIIQIRVNPMVNTP